MTGKYVAPKFDLVAFSCPRCETLTNHNNLHSGGYGVWLRVCTSCNEVTLFDQRGTPDARPAPLVYPVASAAPRPNDDLSDEVRAVYEEASSVLPTSPRSAAALLRLALQMMCIEAKLPGKRIDDDIQALIDTKALRPIITTAMDVVRITGNQAAHPGEIDLNDDSDMALRMFALINVIASDLYTQAREIGELLGKLPGNALKGIETRAARAAAKAEREST